MKKSLLALLGSFCLCFQVAASDPDSSRFQLGVSVFTPGYTSYLYPNFGNDKTKIFEIGFGVQARYSLSKNLYISAVVGYSTGSYISEDSSQYSPGRISNSSNKDKQKSLFTSFCLGSGFKFGRFGIHGGPAVFYNQIFQLESTLTNETLITNPQPFDEVIRNLYQVKTTYPVLHSFGLGFNAGFDFYLSKRLLITMDFQQYYAAQTINSEITTTRNILIEFRNKPTESSETKFKRTTKSTQFGMTAILPFFGIRYRL